MIINNRSGFTLLELGISSLLIILIISSIVVLASASLFGNGPSATQSATVWKVGCMVHDFRESTSKPGTAYCTKCLKIHKMAFDKEE